MVMTQGNTCTYINELTINNNSGNCISRLKNNNIEHKTKKGWSEVNV